MPNCSVVGCGLKKSSNRPNISLHRLPKNDKRKKMWLDAIGIENLKSHTKSIFVCSLHFEESCFNKTFINVVLRDDAVPSKLGLLPPNLLDTAKVVYVARDPRDVLVSMYHLSRSISIWDFIGDFGTHFDLFIRNLTLYTPLFEHVKEAWNKRQHPNLCFIFYEDLKKDLMGTCGRVAELFGKHYSHEQLEKLVEHLHFDNFKNNQAVDPNRYKSSEIMFKQDMAFVRTGKSGGWRQFLSEEQQRSAARWIQDNLQDTDLKYPEV